MGVYIVYSNVFDEEDNQIAKILMHVCATPLVAEKIIEIMKEQDQESLEIYKKYDEFGELWLSKNPSPDEIDEELYDKENLPPQDKKSPEYKVWKTTKSTAIKERLKQYKQWAKNFRKAINEFLEQYDLDFDDLQSFPAFNDEYIEYCIEEEGIVFDVVPKNEMEDEEN